MPVVSCVVYLYIQSNEHKDRKSILCNSWWWRGEGDWGLIRLTKEIYITDKKTASEKIN